VDKLKNSGCCVLSEEEKTGKDRRSKQLCLLMEILGVMCDDVSSAVHRLHIH